MFRLPLILKLFRRTAGINRKRMIMTVAAIAWGTLSIVLLLSFGEGLKRNMTKGSRGLGEGIIVIWPGATSKAFAGFPQGRNLRFVPEDIELLANHFLAQLNKRSNTAKSLTPAAIDRLRRYHWPGNVRELSNAIHRAFIMTDGEWITQIGLSQEPTLAADFSGRSFQVGVGDRIDAVEKRLILATVQHTHTKEAAAEILGISVKTLYNRLRAYESGADLARTAPAHGTTQAPPAGAPSSSETPPRTPAT